MKRNYIILEFIAFGIVFFLICRFVFDYDLNRSSLFCLVSALVLTGLTEGSKFLHRKEKTDGQE